jgi:hypothetical protein
MNSKDWKLSLFALAAVVALSACGHDKKKAPGSPYAGIWINQENLQDYSAHSGELTSGNRQRFCKRVYQNVERYGDSEYRVRALMVQQNGEVFRYSPALSASAAGFREYNLVGSINAGGHFSSGRIGPDGRMVSQWGAGGDIDMISQSALILSGQFITVYSDSGTVTLMRQQKVVVDQYAVHVSSCLQRYKIAMMRYEQQNPYPQGHGPRPGMRPGQCPGPGPCAGRGPGPGPQDKDWDPELEQPGQGRLDPRAAAQPQDQDMDLGEPQDDMQEQPPLRRPSQRR